MTCSRRISTLIEMLSLALKKLFLATGKKALLVSFLSSVLLSLREKMPPYGPGREPGSTVERHDLGEQLKCLPVCCVAPSLCFCGTEDAWGAGAPAVQCVLCTSLVLPVSRVSLSLCTVSVPAAHVREPCLELKLQKWAK